MQNVAVIGIGCRFPGSSNSPIEFFANLKDKKDCVQPTPKQRWNSNWYHDNDKTRAGKLLPSKGGYMDYAFDFDNDAFNTNVKEASNLDPQQRILLEVTHQALEDANINYKG